MRDESEEQVSAARRRNVGDRRGFWYGVAILLLRRPLRAAARLDFRGGEHLPRSGGFVLAVNHISQVDPLYIALYTYEHGRLGRFLAKDSLFTIPILGSILASMQHIPVRRGHTAAGNAAQAAVEAAQAGRCVVVYPEATITRDPQGWPMAGATGAVRIALSAQVPLVPAAQWGAQELWPPYARLPRLARRHPVSIHAGAPVDLGDLAGREMTPAVLREATTRVMDRITAMLADIRGETPPPVRYDPRAHDRRGPEPLEPEEERA